MKHLKLYEEWVNPTHGHNINEGLQDWITKFKQALNNKEFKNALADIEKHFDELDTETQKKISQIDPNEILHKTNEELFNLDVSNLIIKIFYFVLNTKKLKQIKVFYKIAKSLKSFLASDIFGDICNNFHQMQTSEKLTVIVSLMVVIFTYFMKRNQNTGLRAF